MADVLVLVTALFAVLAAIFAILCFIRVNGMASQPALTREVAAQLLRAESEIVKAAGEAQSRGTRQELGASLKDFQQVIFSAFQALGEGVGGQVRGFGEQLNTGVKAIDDRAAAIAKKLDDDLDRMRSEANANREGLRQLIERKLADSLEAQVTSAKELREELGANFQRLGSRVAESLNQASEHQKERLQSTTQALTDLSTKLEKAQEGLRHSVESRLDAIRLESAAKLEEMRQTVDEKLQTTLESRLGESFNRVVEHLERVHKGIGEMQTLAANVGDLKNVLTNVKVRGTYGEVQLELLLEQFLAPDQYIKNVQIVTGSSERVEFAIRLPGKGEGDEVLLPIDSKFPREDYDKLIAAADNGDAKLASHFRRQLEMRIRACAKELKEKYISPPRTIDFGILFLPTESLYAEVLRQPGLVESLQRECRVTLTSPTTLAALLNALQMGFRSLAIEKRSSEVWQVLGAVRNEFGKYNSVVDGLARHLDRAAKSVDTLGTRTRVMARTLKSVETLQDDTAAQKLLGLTPECLQDDLEDEAGVLELLDAQIEVAHTLTS